MKKGNKFKRIKMIIVALMFFLLGFWLTYQSILPNKMQASFYRNLGKIYDEDKVAGNYAIKVEAIEKTNIEYADRVFYILEYSGDETLGWDKEKIKTIFDVPVDYQVDYMLKYDVDPEEMETIDIEKIRQYYLARHNRGIIMLEAKQQDSYIEEIYDNKNNLKEKDYYIAAKIIPRYIDGYRGKVEVIPPRLADKFYEAATKYRKNFSEDLGNVSIEVYASSAELGYIGYTNGILGFIFYMLSLRQIYKIFRECGTRKLEEEGIWEKVDYDKE